MQLTALRSALASVLAMGLALLPQPHLVQDTPRQDLWRPPLGLPLRVSAPYDLANGPYQAGHRGVDMRAVSGQEVVSPANGIVTFVGTVVDRPVLSIRVNDGTVVSLEPLATGLEIGDTVIRGSRLGTLAIGGHCANECLHLGVRVNGHYVNPMRFLISRAILVPW